MDFLILLTVKLCKLIQRESSELQSPIPMLRLKVGGTLPVTPSIRGIVRVREGRPLKQHLGPVLAQLLPYNLVWRDAMLSPGVDQVREMQARGRAGSGAPRVILPVGHEEACVLVQAGRVAEHGVGVGSEEVEPVLYRELGGYVVIVPAFFRRYSELADEADFSMRLGRAFTHLGS